MSNFIVADRKTDDLLPPSLADRLNEDHLARFVVEVVEGLDISSITRQYAGRGSKAHHPTTLLGLLVYGYATGVFSNRKLERATYADFNTPPKNRSYNQQLSAYLFYRQPRLRGPRLLDSGLRTQGSGLAIGDSGVRSS